MDDIANLVPPAAVVYLERRGGYRFSTRYLAKLRSVGGGPGFRKLGRAVVYPKTELDAWLASKTSPVLTRARELPSFFA